MKKSFKGNPQLQSLIFELAHRGGKGQPLWGAVAEYLERPRHQVRPVNLGHLDRHSGPGDVVVVPTKLLASGRLTHPVQVAALAYSEAARRKILESGGNAWSLRELLEKNPEGRGVKILG
jgi:large subunit ribosomal protein L18e